MEERADFGYQVVVVLVEPRHNRLHQSETSAAVEGAAGKMERPENNRNAHFIGRRRLQSARLPGPAARWLLCYDQILLHPLSTSRANLIVARSAGAREFAAPFSKKEIRQGDEAPAALAAGFFGVPGGSGVCRLRRMFFEFAVPYLRLHSNLINGDWSEIFAFCGWMSVPWIVMRQLRKRAFERAREGIHHLNVPYPIE